MAAALVLALTGCEESVPAAGSGKASGAPGENLQGAGDPTQPPIELDPTSLMHALPIESQVGDVMVGGDPFLAQEAEAAEYCAKEEGISCAGLVAVAGKDMEERSDSSDTRVEFRLFSFETAEQAKTAMKGQVDRWRKADAKSGGRWQQKTVESHADETEAVRDDEVDVDVVVMRLGTVVAHIVALDVLPENVQHAVTVQASQVQALGQMGSRGY
ncbi:hypothetical protein OG357_28310 [Streptomyces sp. NBC_01255]|uniref:hypothetical protein n=1 Tax=Streptomyces sp. NBC_01255 TaxID=2903798 RepID=UPI002E36DD87|nr:hypothetical protein [Streptomyces sp. NBC_01255]